MAVVFNPNSIPGYWGIGAEAEQILRLVALLKRARAYIDCDDHRDAALIAAIDAELGARP